MTEEMKLFLNKLSKEFEDILGDNFVGFYIHGSLVTNCFNVNRSDIDFLVVVGDKLSNQIKQEIKDLLLDYSNKTRAVGFDMSIVRQIELDNLKYPTPYEFYFHLSDIETYKTDQNYIFKEGDDPDLPAHLMIIKKRGICVRGKAIDDVIPEIPKKYYLQAIIHDTEWSIGNFFKGPDSGETDVPTYGVLNFCRVLAYIKDDIITSKCEGGEWALENLPAKYHNLIRQGLNKYTGKKYENVSNALIKEFARYTENIIKDIKKTRKTN